VCSTGFAKYYGLPGAFDFIQNGNQDGHRLGFYEKLEIIKRG